MTLNHLPLTAVRLTARAARHAWQIYAVNRRLPLDASYTAPSGQQFAFTIREVFWDSSAFNEQDGKWGVCFCAGDLWYADSQGELRTMRRVLPDYSLTVYR